MEIRKAALADLSIILDIYDSARAYMRSNGNLHQWNNGYPNEDTVRKDIADNNCHVCVDAGEIIGVFVFFVGADPTYAKIYDGQWLNDEPYGVIHRIAVSAHRKGVASACFDFALNHCANLRIDTHEDNIPMQNSLAKNGFTRCGIIYLANGDPRIAYQKTQPISKS